jgi:hypothetical protein
VLGWVSVKLLLVEVFSATELKKLVKSINSIKSIKCWSVKLVKPVSYGLFILGQPYFYGPKWVIFFAQTVVFWAKQVFIGHVFGINK